MAYSHKDALSPRERRVLDLLQMGIDEEEAFKTAGAARPATAARAANKKPPYREQREVIYAERRRMAQITREDVLQGLKSAIEDAKHLEDPGSQIRGWTEIGKILGVYAAKQVEVKLSDDQAARQKQLEGLDEGKLLEMAGLPALDVIEGECEVIQADDAAADG